ncbi:MAG: 50S ribosomal protein L11 methyltransferase [Victivallales bacterium]|nr:50S ribosomal protein L11 methyltransferase [Victivallales bacterium]
MTQESIEVVAIDTPNADVPVLEEALCALELNPSSFSNLETGMATTFLIAENKVEAEKLAVSTTEYLRSWREMFSAEPKLSTKTMRQEDWANSWKKHFHTFRASERLVVKPSWEEYTPDHGDIVIPIDPGMCFGTGYHGTTMACLQYLDKLQAKHGTLSFIDAGTGSGILSIGARLLGYSPIHAFDNDPQCIPTALENLKLAGFTDVEVTCAPLGEYIPEKPADVVAANILCCVLIEQVKDVIALVRPGGYLILSGILTEQYPELRNTFTANACVELENVTIKEWTSGLFKVQLQ